MNIFTTLFCLKILIFRNKMAKYINKIIKKESTNKDSQ